MVLEYRRSQQEIPSHAQSLSLHKPSSFHLPAGDLQIRRRMLLPSNLYEGSFCFDIPLTQDFFVIVSQKYFFCYCDR